ncbi:MULTISPECIES: hypothetical protein [unclassified Achromobacter]|uniref:hypothetical protein n=1 Tax=unclassified Achromobacter TaxID=2626865 RepID=UPI000B518249|nr:MULTISPECIES: hypothetical protein [unclassified Achromobacter]OWT72700.1 hypothetical protein CEY05_22585 [Achromobacter sp. HZ34]OWT73919.1 hypothetical protein CEY04_21410 [Achromobacter sp. HZ28]
MQETITASFDFLVRDLSIPVGKRSDAATRKTVATIQRLFEQVKRLAALMPDEVPRGASAVISVFEKEAYRCVDALSSAAFSRLSQGPLSPRAEQADAHYRDALLMRLHRCTDLPAQTVLASLEQALRGRHIDQVHVAWLATARRELGHRTAATLARRAACLTVEQDRRKLQSALHGIFLGVDKGQPATLEAGVGVLLALARLGAAVYALYQRCLPFGILNEARQELQRIRIPTPLAIAADQWQQYCQSWKHEYIRRIAALDRIIGDLQEACGLPDGHGGIRTRRAALGLSQLAALLRVGLAGQGMEDQPADARLDPARHGDIGHRDAQVAEVVRAAAEALGLHGAPAHAEDDGARVLRQATVLSALSDKEFAALVSAADVMAAFGRCVDARAVTAERDRRVGEFGQVRFRPCLERLVAEGDAEDLHRMADVGVYLRDATDALLAMVTLYSVCGGKLDGAEETAAFIEKAVNLALPGLRIAPARAQVLHRLSLALNHARVDLASHDPGLLHDDPDDLLAREDLMQGIAEGLACQEEVPDIIEGAFFTLIRRTSFAARLGAFVSSAPARIVDGAVAGKVAEPDQDEDVLADADIRLALQSDFGIEVQENLLRDALARSVRWPDWAQPMAVREIYKEELSFKDPPIQRLSGVAATGAPGSYPVDATVVNEDYAKDYLRGSCSLSVRGRAPDGTPISFDAVMAGPIVDAGPDAQARKRARSNAVEDALRCLSRMVDAGQFQQLTRLLSQMAAAPTAVAETRSAIGTPLRLASGTPLQVGGPAHTHTLIEQNLDDTFDMSYHVEWLNVKGANLVDQDTCLPSATLDLDPALSRKAVRYAWRVIADELPVVQPLRLPEYRYCLVPA